MGLLDSLNLGIDINTVKPVLVKTMQKEGIKTYVCELKEEPGKEPEVEIKPYTKTLSGFVGEMRDAMVAKDYEYTTLKKDAEDKIKELNASIEQGNKTLAEAAKKIQELEESLKNTQEAYRQSVADFVALKEAKTVIKPETKKKNGRTKNRRK